MSMPGFDAEQSLVKAAGTYRGAKSWGGGADGTRSEKIVVQSWTVQNCTLVWNGATGQTQRQCYTDRKFRSATVLSECPGADKSGALCYPFCTQGYYGVGPICWERCPDGYNDDGVTCRRDAKIISADNSQCPWFDKCGLTLRRGCSKCPSGYANDGCTCRQDAHIFGKRSYGRGVGSPMSCLPGEEQIGGLCYSNCPPGYMVAGGGVFCDAITQTCQDVPVTTPPDTSVITRFCFERRNPDSPWVSPCTPVFTSADTEEHAKQLLQCECTNCTLQRVDCSALDAGTVCH